MSLFKPLDNLRGGLFVTGTDTDVGKTVVSALLLAALEAQGIQRRYFKPIQTGAEPQLPRVKNSEFGDPAHLSLPVPENSSDTLRVCQLSGLSPDEVIPSIYTYPEPISPNRAAALHGQQIEMEKICLEWEKHEMDACTVVEGAGGILVPINSRELTRDLIMYLDLPVVIVSSTRLGTLNHTLLTLEAARAVDLIVHGIILVGEEDPGLETVLSEFSSVPVLAHVPKTANLSPLWIKEWGPKLFPRAVLETFWEEV